MLRTSAQTRHYIFLGEIPRPRSRTRLQLLQGSAERPGAAMNTCGNSRQCLSAGLPTFERSTTGHSRLNVSRQSAQMGSPRRSQATSRPGRSNDRHARATARCDVETKLRSASQIGWKSWPNPPPQPHCRRVCPPPHHCLPHCPAFPRSRLNADRRLSVCISPSCARDGTALLASTGTSHVARGRR